MTFVATQVTRVVPVRKQWPLGGVQVTTNGMLLQVFTACGAKFTTAQSLQVRAGEDERQRRADEGALAGLQYTVWRPDTPEIRRDLEVAAREGKCINDGAGGRASRENLGQRVPAHVERMRERAETRGDCEGQ